VIIPRTNLLQELESVLAENRPRLAERLQPGLPEMKIRKMLSKGQIEGAIDALVALYKWKDGTILSALRSRDDTPMAYHTFRIEVSFVPKHTYFFTSLERAINDFDFIKQIASRHPTAASVAGRYFPILCNGATEWFALDLNSGADSRVAIIQPKAEDTCREAYSSFEAFIFDVIRANREDDSLNCFR
jgi:hypothetical protein